MKILASNQKNWKRWMGEQNDKLQRFGGAKKKQKKKKYFKVSLVFLSSYMRIKYNDHGSSKITT